VAASGALGDIPQYLLRRHGLSIDQILQFRVHFANGIGGDRPTRGVQARNQRAERRYRSASVRG